MFLNGSIWWSGACASPSDKSDPRTVKIICSDRDYLDGSADEYIRAAIRMEADRIVVEMVRKGD